MDSLLDDSYRTLFQLQPKDHRAFHSRLLVGTKHEREDRHAALPRLLPADRMLSQFAFEHAWATAKSDRPVCAMDSRRKNAFQSRVGSRLRLCTTLLFQLSFYSRHLRYARVVPS